MRELPGLIKVDFAEFVRQLRRNWLWVLGIPILAVVAAFLLSQLPTKQYQATARLLAAQPTAFQGNTGNLGQTSPIDSEAYREAALGSRVLRNAFGADVNLEQLRRIIRVRTNDGRQSGTILLNVRRPDPKQAADEANAWAAALREWDDNRVRQSYSRTRSVIEAELANVRTQIASGNLSTDRLAALRSREGSLIGDRDSIRALELGASGQLSVLDEAEVPTRSVSPRPVLNALIAGLLAFVAVVLWLLGREVLTSSVRGSEDAAKATGLTILGEFPELPAGADRTSLPNQAASYLRTNVNHDLADEEVKIIAVTSPDPEEGKSSVAVALARAYARTGKPTLLIDLDLRRPVLHSLFEISEGPDITSVPNDPYLNVSAHKIDRDRPLYLLPCLKDIDEPVGLLADQFRYFLNRLRDSGEWSHIIIDTAPVLAVDDTLVIAPQVSGVVMVSSVGKTNRRHLMVAVDSLRRIGAKLLGLSVNRVRADEGVLMSGRGYGFGYGYEKVGRAVAVSGPNPSLERTPEEPRATKDLTVEEDEDVKVSR